MPCDMLGDRLGRAAPNHGYAALLAALTDSLRTLRFEALEHAGRQLETYRSNPRPWALLAALVDSLNWAHVAEHRGGWDEERWAGLHRGE